MGTGRGGGLRLDITSSDRTWTELNLLGRRLSSVVFRSFAVLFFDDSQISN